MDINEDLKEQINKPVPWFYFIKTSLSCFIGFSWADCQSTTVEPCLACRNCPEGSQSFFLACCTLSATPGSSLGKALASLWRPTGRWGSSSFKFPCFLASSHRQDIPHTPRLEFQTAQSPIDLQPLDAGKASSSKSGMVKKQPVLLPKFRVLSKH